MKVTSLGARLRRTDVNAGDTLAVAPLDVEDDDDDDNDNDGRDVKDHMTQPLNGDNDNNDGRGGGGATFGGMAAGTDAAGGLTAGIDAWFSGGSRGAAPTPPLSAGPATAAGMSGPASSPKRISPMAGDDAHGDSVKPEPDDDTLAFNGKFRS
nr:hypothetical protein HK105_007701 [Polyrhizophydium stewartii]